MATEDKELKTRDDYAKKYENDGWFEKYDKTTYDKVKNLFGKEAADKIGTYKEATGGGTPLAKNEKLKDHPEAKRVLQPRDEEGRFTYNAVNGRDLKYPSSRGTTPLPFMKGKKIVFANPIDGAGKNTVNIDGLVHIATINQSYDAFLKGMRRYYGKDAGFEEADMGTFERKKGRLADDVKEAVKSGETGVLQNVKGNTSKGRSFETINRRYFELGVYNAVKEVKSGKTPPINPKMFVPEQPKPEQPKPEPVKEQPKEPAQEETKQTPEQPKNAPTDVELAKNDQKAFVEKYSEQIDDLKEYAEQKGVGVVLDSVTEDFANGKTFDDMKKEIDSFSGTDSTKNQDESNKEKLQKQTEETKKETPVPNYVPGEKTEKPELPTMEEKQVEQPKEKTPQPAKNKQVSTSPQQQKEKPTVKSIAAETGFSEEETRKVLSDLKGKYGKEKVSAEMLKNRLKAIKAEREKEAQENASLSDEEQQAIKNDREAYKEKYAKEITQIVFDTGMKIHEILDAILNRQKLPFGIKANSMQDVLEYAKKHKEEKKKAEKAYGMNFR